MWQLSQDLGIPVRTLEAQAVETQLEPVELLIAHRLARESKLSLEELVVEFRRRGAWGAIVERYAVEREKLIGQVGEFLRATEGSSASRPARASR
jgi:hypothetical protein